MTILELTIDDVGDQGDGIARHNNATIFVNGALTGERVKVKLEESKNLVQRAELLEVLVPSSWRVTPPCDHFEKCGGCKLQHMNDDSYTNFKLGQLQNALKRANIDVPPFMAPVITAAKTRRRARLAARHTANGIVIGFNEWRSNFIVDIEECPVTQPVLVNLIQKLRKSLNLWLPSGESCDIQLTALHDGIDMLLIGGPPLGLEQRETLAELAAYLNIAHLSWKKWDRSPAEPIAHMLPLGVNFGETRIPFPPGSFLQATPAGEKALIEFTQSVCKPNARILDLFCGLGTFGLSMKDPKSVHFVDIDGPAVEALEKEATRNNLFDVSLRHLINNPLTSGECNDYDIAIIDPPRGGAKVQMQHLANSDVPNIVSVSCDPTSFARDSKILAEGGYSMESIQPVDQFLWSTHLECIAHFSRK